MRPLIPPLLFLILISNLTIDWKTFSSSTSAVNKSAGIRFAGPESTIILQAYLVLFIKNRVVRMSDREKQALRLLRALMGTDWADGVKIVTYTPLVRV